MDSVAPDFAVSRREHILDELRRVGAVRVSTLARELAVSELTIRRDIGALAERGLLTRVHGGATLRSRLDTTIAHPATAGPSLYRVGMVVPSLSYYWPQIIFGARAAATEHGVQLALRGASYSTADQRRQINSLVGSGTIHGLIVAPETSGADGIALLEWLDALPIPVVLAERHAPASTVLTRLEWVTSDHAFGGALAARHLASLGHQRIGIVAAAASPTSGRLRRGWSDAVSELALESTIDRELTVDALDDADRDAAIDALLDDCRVSGTTALLVHSDPQAVLIQQRALDNGWHVPGDLSIVAYDDEVAAATEPRITALRPPKQQVGRLAVETMVARLTDGVRRPRQRVTLLPELHARESATRLVRA